jgi:D-alanine-D-alanine ligase
MAPMKKKIVAIVCGGQSSEHEISCISARAVLAAIDQEKFDAIVLGITKTGKWVYVSDPSDLEVSEGQLPEISEDLPSVTASVQGFFISHDRLHVDVIFPLLHGPYGEDGTIQGFCELAGVRYVGSGVLASAIGMDKSIAKSIFQSAGLSVAPGIVVKVGEAVPEEVSQLRYPLFVKPARSGSSRGTSKVASESQLQDALTFAFEFDSKVLIEQAIMGREIECGILEVSGKVQASKIGEIKIRGDHEFYDFEAKYLDDATYVLFPADLPVGTEEAIQREAVAAFIALNCEGLARVDFFYTNDGAIIINELNTMPGFTQTSMYPKLWEKTGKSYTDLISTLIDSALTRSKSVVR